MALDKWEKKHVANIAKYEKEIQQIYATAIAEASQMASGVNFDPSKPFVFSDYPLTKALIAKLQKQVASDIEAVITKGVDTEFGLSQEKAEELAQSVYSDVESALMELRKRAYISQRNKAREAFLTRKEAGLSLSDRVWRYTGQFKEELEMALDLGLRDGLSADELSREVRKYLNNPNMLFRRVRDEHGVLHLSKRAKAYHPGQGVYRSSYKNARRLTATETNMAYRTADYNAYQALSFVVGIRIMLSNNHTLNGEPFFDICDNLSAPNGSIATKGKGCYPKDFKFTGWHPLCRCFVQTIHKTKEELREDTHRMREGLQPLPPEQSANYVGDVPDEFKAWCRLNAGRVERAKSVPYFIRDNQEYYDSVIAPKYGGVQGVKLGRTAEKEAYKLYNDLPAPTLSKEVVANTKDIANSLGVTYTKPMTFLEANEGRSNVNYSKGLEYKENCQCCVVTHEARLRGLNITSVGYSYNRASMSWKLGERFEMAWINPKTNNIPVVQVVKGNNDNATLLALEKQMQAVGRYHIGVNFKNGSGHIITAERLKNGNLIYYDAQNGEFLNIKDYAALDYLEVLKVDKLLINKNVLMEIVELL
jgi:ribosomal protein S24E